MSKYGLLKPTEPERTMLVTPWNNDITVYEGNDDNIEYTCDKPVTVILKTDECGLIKCSDHVAMLVNVLKYIANNRKDNGVFNLEYVSTVATKRLYEATSKSHANSNVFKAWTESELIKAVCILKVSMGIELSVRTKNFKTSIKPNLWNDNISIQVYDTFKQNALKDVAKEKASRIEGYVQKGLSLKEATKRATKDMAQTKAKTSDLLE